VVYLALVRDLIFVSPIRAAAERLGVSIRFVRNPETVGEALTDVDVSTPLRVLLDCNLPGAIAATAKLRDSGRHVVAVGFVSHVDAETIAQARTAGITRVVARSTFFADPSSFLA
jgi:DNA-binding NarL/FixJ family response regulator